MNILVTGGAGFIGRWVVKKLLDDGHKVWILDNLSNGSKRNIEEFINNSNLIEFTEGDIKDIATLERLFLNKFDLCYHLAASINVQDSIDDPVTTFQNDTVGTFYVLEQCRKHNVKMVFMSTCMVYDRAKDNEGIDESHPVKPASPYAGSKIAGENMVLSYWYAYKLPTVVIRPFNTYGPMQRTDGEGGVVAIFIKRSLEGLPLNIYGDGKQTRDLLYVEDCAEFVVQAGYSDRVNGEIVNAGLGRDISINDLALLISGDASKIKHVPHIHPQSEIPKLLCNAQKAKNLLGWYPKTSLEEGIAKTKEWITEQAKT
ncbi:SDR family NAD(P)-dependent oxidoreductase [Acetivibrio clariflavus]|uniref:Nucleoside-diphosphate-sugar epimerase n=1 Tax=Acetivibrio clariflavus (strain DSM 19732 / NBRC 101661 / EBR45) TaxID=720554 RepID=G8LSZ8_ACECE|nr:SDR family NAD(P)-dependent oxidoreductase [Acetivibrio clariflavus]AEV70511.1 nucleoside-diphosphate-sugar epimerase [Acetivibrio clariflavus DSM 19732]